MTVGKGKRPAGQKRDFMEVARSVVEAAIGEKMDGSPIDKPTDRRNPHAVALGSIGGKKGGKARAQTLTAERRVEIARSAAKKRWSSKKSGHD